MLHHPNFLQNLKFSARNLPARSQLFPEENRVWEWQHREQERDIQWNIWRLSWTKRIHAYCLKNSIRCMWPVTSNHIDAVQHKYKKLKLITVYWICSYQHCLLLQLPPPPKPLCVVFHVIDQLRINVHECLLRRASVDCCDSGWSWNTVALFGSVCVHTALCQATKHKVKTVLSLLDRISKSQVTPSLQYCWNI